ncbi:hypothetical protein SAMN05444483_103258 [Salegentibacter echinorum]|uniref:Riboflavin synthase subunit beta n=1 Tax=Salegentibacter echinorum TaxID=1073325 RepID=A0A1M5FML4_SALEC|nr:hypothetical protein [Salegentibacter echinorum]SHF92664.1 hypothetical protein SAMN05444483_103258 [Salegentibacter echinorum]
MKINFYKARKNNRYNYTPRYYKGKDTGNIYNFDSKFAKYKETTNSIDFGAQWADVRKSSRNRGNREINRRLLIIISILILVFLWIIDFDLSIFSNPR